MHRITLFAPILLITATALQAQVAFTDIDLDADGLLTREELQGAVGEAGAEVLWNENGGVPLSTNDVLRINAARAAAAAPLASGAAADDVTPGELRALARSHRTLAERHRAVAQSHDALATSHAALSEAHLAVAEGHGAMPDGAAIAADHAAQAQDHAELADAHRAKVAEHRTRAEEHEAQAAALEARAAEHGGDDAAE